MKILYWISRHDTETIFNNCGCGKNNDKHCLQKIGSRKIVMDLIYYVFAVVRRKNKNIYMEKNILYL